MRAYDPPNYKIHRDKGIHKERMMTSMHVCQKSTIRPGSDATSFGIYGETPTLQGSYEVEYQNAKCQKPHVIAEELIKPCAEKMVEIMIGSGTKK